MNKNALRVLLADDSEDDRTLLTRTLRAFPGLELTGVTMNGVDTIAWLSAAPPFCDRKEHPYPDLLMLDYQMPGCSGLEVIEWLHTQPRHPCVVLWSHTPELIDRPRAYELGAALVCAKPNGPAALNTILGRVFAARQWTHFSQSETVHTHEALHSAG
jgi:two-component system, response regulator